MKNFKNGTEFNFKSGVNIIVGENGCGKTTLMKLIEAYLMVDKEECDRGIFNSNINRLYQSIGKDFLGGVSVIADYEKNTFRLCHVAEKNNDQVMKNFRNFGTFFEQKHASTGDGVHIALKSLFNMMFSKEAKLKFDYTQFKEDYPAYTEYINNNKLDIVKNGYLDEWTILMDEPDRNLSIDNIEDIKSILSIHKEKTQVIAVIHNPILIYSLSKIEGINFIEMTKGYVDKVIRTLSKLIK